MRTTIWQEIPVCVECCGQRLTGIVVKPSRPEKTGLVIVVGGPQYRAGSHRQFTLLARKLADNGIASVRFDYRGMGDSEGDVRNFENVDDDIRAAADALFAHVPELRRIALWGLCDAASAALYYGPTDDRVSDLILLNPWVHSPVGAAKARIRHYYLTRLMQRSFWQKLLSGRVKLGGSIRDIANAIPNTVESINPDPRHGGPGYIDRMLAAFNRFSGKAHIILSGKDLTAQQFEQLVAGDRRWQRVCSKDGVIREKLLDANHTFSSRSWREQVENLTISWIRDAS
jgi:exosortase A-associated hydrolase 1